MSSIARLRLEAQELQNMHIVVVHGVRDDMKDVCAIGWVEDKPHDEGEAVILNEPLYCVYKGAQLRFIGPSWGLPLSTEIFEYTKVDVYEGITKIAATYIQHVLKAREYVPQIDAGFIPETAVAPAKPVALPPQR